MNIVFDIELIIRLVLAAILGYAIGLERRLTGHAAGDRTFALTALGSAMFAVISLRAFPEGDTRIAAGVVTGLGFLGAGMILKGQEREVKGLTTAAGIWTVGAVGLAAGAGAYGIAIVGAALTLFLLASEQLLHIDQRIQARRKRRAKPKVDAPSDGENEQKESDTPR
ncbi:MAG: MgtC/SapB transporter, partial [Chloroflexi bacterium]|nr:MgtC/SapB transporter [Chloroflexota bacterium]